MHIEGKRLGVKSAARQARCIKRGDVPPSKTKVLGRPRGKQINSPGPIHVLSQLFFNVYFKSKESEQFQWENRPT